MKDGKKQKRKWRRCLIKDVALFLDRFGRDRMKTLFFRIRADLLDKTDDVISEMCACSGCGQNTMLIFKYRLKGGEE
mgnify:FL=1